MLIWAIVLVFVGGPVLILTPLFAWHYRISNTKDAFRPNWGFSWPLEFLVWLPPTLIVVGLAVVLWIYTHRLDPYAPLTGRGPAMKVQVVALDWKWLFIYPDEHLATVNQLDVPVGRPVRLEMTSATVMQSLLLPRLAGQIYAMGGMTTQLVFAADHPGDYLGENTQYNGQGFQDDKFTVVARPAGDYARWVAAARRAPPLDEVALRAILARSTQPRPELFSDTPAGLFEHIRMMTGGAGHAAMRSGR